jgi:hypothetical protein
MDPRFFVDVGGSQAILEIPAACALDADARTKTGALGAVPIKLAER